MADFVPFGSFLALGEESTAGTAVTRTVFLPIISSAIKLEDRFTPRSHLSRNGSRVAGGSFRGRIDVGGPSVTELGYLSHGLLLKAIFGAASTSGAGPTYDHTYSLGTSPVYMTAEQRKGTEESGSNVAEVFAGCLANRAQITIEAGGEMRCETTWLGMSSGGPVSPSSGTVVDVEPILAYEGDTFTWNSNAYDFERIEFIIDNGFVARPYVGSRNSAAPKGVNGRSVLIRVTRTISGSVLWSSYQAGDQSDFSLAFTDGTSTAAFLGHNCKISSYASPIQGTGYVRETIEFMPHSDASDTGLELTITNSQSTAVAA